MTTKTTEQILLDINKNLSNANEKIQFQTQNVEQNFIVNEPNNKGETKLLGKKVKRNGKKVNNEYCAACEKGEGNLLSCEECVRSYHMECLKLTEKDIPENGWLCPICALKKEKKDKKEKKVTKPKSNIKTEKENVDKAKKVNTRTRRGKNLNKNPNPNPNNKENVNKENIKQENNKEANVENKVNNNANKEKNKENPKEKIKNKNVKKRGGGRPKKNAEKNKNNKNAKVNNAKPNNDKNNNANANNNTNEKMNPENKNINNISVNEEEYYGETNLISKTELINFLKNLSQKEIKNINELNLSEEISKILKNSSSIKAITNLINTNKDLSKYKNSWNLLIEKKILQIVLDTLSIIQLNAKNYIQI
jgi:hypothetical protein